MPFWTYMLHCADRSFYVGHTDDLDRRIAQHRQGAIPGHTQRRRPATLVWVDVFPTRDEARQAEAQIKGWRREKKLALIRNDWVRLSTSAKGRERSSTSSGQAGTGMGGPAKPASGASTWLHPHPEALPSEPFALEVRVRLGRGDLRLHFRLTGPIETIAIPPPGAPIRADGLWQHTCFEAFVRPAGGTAYAEVNLSPSGAWAVYRFDDRRAGMAAADVAAPEVEVKIGRYALELAAKAQLPFDPAGATLNLAAVIEEGSGRRSFWALAHPPSGPPDFHDPACFMLELPPTLS